VGDPAEGLDRGEENVRVLVPLLALVEAQVGVGPDPPVGVAGLVQDLLAVGDEQDPPELGALGVEGAQPGLAEAGGEDDEAGGVALRPRGFEGFQGLLLDGVGREDRGRLVWDLDRGGPFRRFARRAALPAGVDPLACELLCGRVSE